MVKQLANWLWGGLCDWLVAESKSTTIPLCDFSRLRYELRPGDVVLVEGRSRISEVIKLITQSSWTHSALYVGRLFDIEDQALRNIIRKHYHGDPNEKLLIEALLGEGTVVVPVTKYKRDHLRICRPTGLSPSDAKKVIAFAVNSLGLRYDVRHLLDLARFFFPWAILPRRWRSSLFQHNAGEPTHTVCSSMLAEAFTKVDFPILPFIDRTDDGTLRFFKRNPRLFTPKDFDYSPYFNIIKYPFLGLDDLGVYRKLPWADDSLVYNDENRMNFPEETEESTQVEPEGEETEEAKIAEKQKAEVDPNASGPFLKVFKSGVRFSTLKRGG